MKKVSMTRKPQAKQVTSMAAAEQWIQSRSAKEPMKRLTIDVPVSLHQRIKTQCAMDGVQMADIIREMLRHRFTR